MGTAVGQRFVVGPIQHSRVLLILIRNQGWEYICLYLVKSFQLFAFQLLHYRNLVVCEVEE